MSYIEIIEPDESFVLVLGKSEFDLRRFDSAKYNEIEKRHTQRIPNRSGGFTIEVDSAAVNADLLDYMIIGWRKVRSPVTKADIPCTYETKQKLPGGVKLKITQACDAESITVKEKNDVSGKPSPDISSID